MDSAPPQRYVLEKRTVPPGIPVWLMHDEGRADAPLVILQHGYTGNKENNLGFALKIASRGYRVVLPDARMHGDRRTSDFEARFGAEFERTFMEVVTGTAEDISTLIDTFGASSVAMVGISMGAFITYLALTQDKRIEVAVPLIGSPVFFTPVRLLPEEEALLAGINPAAHPERFPPCALLIQHGELDELVPIQPDAELAERLRPYYAESPERLQFIPYPNVGHEVPPAMADATFAWLERFFPVES